MPTARRSLIGAALVLATGPAAAITIEFDYRFDVGPAPLSAAQRSVLDFVATEFGQLISTEFGPGFYNQAFLADPGGTASASGLPGTSVTALSLPADTIRVFAGSTELGPLGSGTLGVASIGGYSINSSNHPGGLDTPLESWGGAVSFDTSTNWYVDSDPATTEPFSGFDFYTVAAHELGHILGIGSTASWLALVQGNGFTGRQSVAAYSAATGFAESAVPLDAVSAHWRSGVSSFVDGVAQAALMGPTLASGLRRQLTDLDLAALGDIGWQLTVTAVPEPAPATMLLAGLALVGFAVRRRISTGPAFSR